MTGDPTVELRVRGGAAGVVAVLEEVERAGRRLRALAVDVGELARSGAALAVSPTLLTSIPFSPGTAAVAEARLLAAVGPTGLMGAALRLHALAEAMAHALDLYRAWDAGVAVSLRAGGLVAGEVVGRLLAPVGLVTGVTAGVVALVDHLAGSSEGCVGPGSSGLLTAAGVVGGAALGGVASGGVAAGVGTGGVAAGEAGPVGAAVVAATGGLGDTRGLEVLLGTVPGFLDGLLPFPVGAVVARSVGEPWPVTDMASAAGVAAAVAGAAGLLREPGRVRVTGVSRGTGVAPAGLGGLIGEVPDTAPGPARVRVVGLTAPDGRRSWVVGIPGTRTWRWRDTGDPFDLTGDVHGVAGHRTAAGEAVLAAMREAGVPSGEPVLLAGYSQGGIVAASLAADALVRREFSVTHLVTAGAPIGGAAVPPGISVLSLEHDEDVVPRLEGEVNPAGPGWTTVSRRISADPALAARLEREPFAAHELDVYRGTAALAGAAGDVSVDAWQAGAQQFVSGPGVRAVVTDVSVVREPVVCRAGESGCLSSRAGGTAW